MKWNRLLRLAAIAAVTGLLLCPPLRADWGDLKGRFVVDDSVPDPKAVAITKDAEFCGQHDVVDERVVADDEGNLANVFVYIYLGRGQTIEIHPDLADPPSEPVVLDNEGCRFEPHALVIRTGQTLEVRNSDPIGHNTNVTLRNNPDFNQIIPQDDPLIKTFARGEVYPANVACNIHPWMNARMLVREDPYMAVSVEDGTFEISKMPAGTHEFIFWHEAPGNLRDLEVGDAKTDRRGRAKIEIVAGETLDLGDIKVPASALR